MTWIQDAWKLSTTHLETEKQHHHKHHLRIVCFRRLIYKPHTKQSDHKRNYVSTVTSIVNETSIISMYNSNKFHFNETVCVVISMASTDLNWNRSRPIFCFVLEFYFLQVHRDFSLTQEELTLCGLADTYKSLPTLPGRTRRCRRQVPHKRPRYTESYPKLPQFLLSKECAAPSLSCKLPWIWR